jgi:hypothetical protein
VDGEGGERRERQGETPAGAERQGRPSTIAAAVAMKPRRSAAST